MSDCVFCKVISGELPSYKIYEDDMFIVILDVFPVTKGHTLLITKKHTPNVSDIHDEVLSKMMPLANKMNSLIRESIGCQDVHMLIQDGPGAQQEIPHTHMHLIPRSKGDGMDFVWHQPKEIDNELLTATLSEMKKHL